MSILINNITMPTGYSIAELKDSVASVLGVQVSDISAIKIHRESLDARRVKLNYNVAVVVDIAGGDAKILKSAKANVAEYLPQTPEVLVPGMQRLHTPPVVIGSGPSGIFAGYVLAQMGYNPIIFERGEDVDARSTSVNNFWKRKKLNVQSNVQFGEGGAGTFSDGKLTTRIGDYRCNSVIQTLIKNGAPADIAYKSKPHIGTDNLKIVVKNMREMIIKLGGKVNFNSQLTGVNIKDGAIKSVVINGGTTVECEALILAIGHSARDTYEMLHKSGVFMEPKGFSVGVRIEHPQKTINAIQYGEEHDKTLPAADYQMSCRSGNRGCYTFCMCPGGVITPASSEEFSVVTNGMSMRARSAINANSAIVVGVDPQDYMEGNDPLSGIDFQRKIERAAYVAGGSNYCAPAQLVGDFMAGKPSTRVGTVRASYECGIEWGDLSTVLPEFAVSAIKVGIRDFGLKMKGFNMPDAVLTGVETRTSSPVRITREADGCAVGIAGLYPVGEGAGYAGGIMSAATDGIKAAERIIAKYAAK